jgi:hypothetical protein
MAKDAAINALDDIAKLCGCAEWEYPGQVVRDVEVIVRERERTLRSLYATRARDVPWREALAGIVGKRVVMALPERFRHRKLICARCGTETRYIVGDEDSEWNAWRKSFEHDAHCPVHPLATKRRVFVCTPLRADTLDGRCYNVNFARRVCHEAIVRGYVPFAPHLLYTQMLDDGDAAERELGIDCGLQMLHACHELWWAMPRNTLEHSDGMKTEIALAQRIGIPVKRVLMPDGPTDNPQQEE